MSRSKLTPEQLAARVHRLTGRHVAKMVRMLSAYQGQPGQRWMYDAFRREKRAVYKLYPDQPDKAKAIVNFALVRSGWASKGTRG